MHQMLRRVGSAILAVSIALLGMLAIRPAVARAWQLVMSNPKAVSAILIEPNRTRPLREERRSSRARRPASPR